MGMGRTRGRREGEGGTGGSEPSRETVATENPGQREPASNQRNGWDEAGKGGDYRMEIAGKS